MKRILLTGCRGMLAHDFLRVQSDQFEIFWFDRADLDICDVAAVESRVREIRPQAIFNCAAYTNVDEAEDAGRKANFDVNALGVFYLATVAQKCGIDFVTVSTDYVFDGTREAGYDEDAVPNPINAYGLSKYLGETLARQACENAIVVRTSWLYGWAPYRKGNQPGTFKNFVNTMLRLSESRDELRVVNDQFGSPTYAADLSLAIGEILRNPERFRWEILHLSNETPDSGISWFDFAAEIFRQADIRIRLIPCASDEYPTKAVRPKFSKMRNGSAIRLGDWKEGLEGYFSR